MSNDCCLFTTNNSITVYARIKEKLKKAKTSMSLKSI